VAEPHIMDNIMTKPKAIITLLISIFIIGQSAASTVETFDSSASTFSTISVDDFAGDRGSEWRDSKTSTNFDGNLLFNFYPTNSFTLLDKNQQIESFQFEEFEYELYLGQHWTWTFYDASDSIVSTLGYINDGDESIIHTIDLLNLGFLNVVSVQLEHRFGWVNIDNLTYGNISTVPLPAAAFLLGPALLGFLGFRRKAKETA